MNLVDAMKKERNAMGRTGRHPTGSSSKQKEVTAHSCGHRFNLISSAQVKTDGSQQTTHIRLLTTDFLTTDYSQQTIYLRQTDRLLTTDYLR